MTAAAVDSMPGTDESGKVTAGSDQNAVYFPSGQRLYLLLLQQQPHLV